MEATGFSNSITVTLSPQEVYDKIFELDKWWTKDIKFPGAEKNDEFVIRHSGDTHFSHQRLIESIPGEKIVWLITESQLGWLENDKEEWTNTKLFFEISGEDGKTIINFTHEGLAPTMECYERCVEGWDLVIGQHLFKYLETGEMMARHT